MSEHSPFAAGADFEANRAFDRDQKSDCHFDPTANAWYSPIDRGTLSVAGGLAASDSSREEQLHKLSMMMHRPDDFRRKSGGSRPARATAEQNQRQFSRCPIPDDQTTGVLTMNGHRYDCRLVEVSIGGFGVVMKGCPSFAQGSTGLLRSPGLSFVVSVTRQESRPGEVYLGLKQVSEIVNTHRLPGKAPAVVNYLIAAFSGIMIVIASYFFMYGGRV